MKYIKIYESFDSNLTEEQIEFLDDNCAGWSNSLNGIIIEDTLNLKEKNLTQIPVKFYEVKNNCTFHRNQLTSLFNSPQIVGNIFVCSDNQLTSLQYSPQTLKELICATNKLTSLQYCPQNLTDLSFYNNLLTSLYNCPRKLTEVNCSINKLTSLQYCPQELNKLNCSDNLLTSLQYCPQTINELDCSNNPLKNLQYCPQTLGKLSCQSIEFDSLQYGPLKCKYVRIVDNLIRKSDNEIKDDKFREKFKEIVELGKFNDNLEFYSLWFGKLLYEGHEPAKLEIPELISTREKFVQLVKEETNKDLNLIEIFDLLDYITDTNIKNIAELDLI